MGPTVSRKYHDAGNSQPRPYTFQEDHEERPDLSKAGASDVVYGALVAIDCNIPSLAVTSSGRYVVQWTKISPSA